MSTVLSKSVDQATHEHGKEYFCWVASVRFNNEDEEPITITRLHDWAASDEVCGPLSRDEFIHCVREQRIDDTTIIWEVWDGTRVWPAMQAEKLALFREARRSVIPRPQPLTTTSTEPSDDVSANELVGSVLKELEDVPPPTKPIWLWRIPLIGWLLALLGWKPRSPYSVATPADSLADSPTQSLSSASSVSGKRVISTTLTTDQVAARQTDFDSATTTTEHSETGMNQFGGISLDGLEDAEATTAPTENHDLPATAFRLPVADAAPMPVIGINDVPSDEPLPTGDLHGAISNALNYFDAKTGSHTDTVRKDRPRLTDQLMMLVIQAGRLAASPFRGLFALAVKAVASERTLVTGETFQRLEASLRRGLRHPLTWGVLAGAVFLGSAFLFMALQPDRPDDLDFYAIKKMKEAQEAIQAVRGSKPDEQAWTDFAHMLGDELNLLKEALHRDMKINRPVKEGLYLALEYRLPRILKDGRLKPSAAEGEFANRIREAERQIKLQQR